MSTYADVFVIPVPKQKSSDYKALAELSATVWREAGALSYVEFEADDVKPGQWTSFPQSVDMKEGEFVVVALIQYTSRQHRDEVNARAMKDPRMARLDPKTFPFDSKRMYWGGFKPLVGEIPLPSRIRGRGFGELLERLQAGTQGRHGILQSPRSQQRICVPRLGHRQLALQPRSSRILPHETLGNRLTFREGLDGFANPAGRHRLPREAGVNGSENALICDRAGRRFRQRFDDARSLSVRSRRLIEPAADLSDISQADVGPDVSGVRRTGFGQFQKP